MNRALFSLSHRLTWIRVIPYEDHLSSMSIESTFVVKIPLTTIFHINILSLTSIAITQYHCGRSGEAVSATSTAIMATVVACLKFIIP
mgnify:CR=1 FL=1